MTSWPHATGAAPHRPSDDAEVLEVLPTAPGDPATRELAALARRLAERPGDAALAVTVAWRYYELAAAAGDPRYVGYAQAALAPWWALPEPPAAVRVLRAVLLQYGHAFEPAAADLEAVLRQTPDDVQAWAWLAAIRMVQARFREARTACERAAPLTTPLNAVACGAAVDAVTGRGSAAAAALDAALAADPGASAAERLWALTRLAETRERLGHFDAAEAAYRAALALQIDDVYLEAAYADFLLDRGRAAEVVRRLVDRRRADVLLLRLAIAGQATNDPRAADWRLQLGARFDAARLRGDALHRKEEARYALQLQGDARRALALARENFELQREPADARVLLEAAVAAHDAQAAAPALAWRRDSGIESVVLDRLAAALAPAR